MARAASGGADWHFDQDTGAGQRGVFGGIGLSNLGLLVRVAGLVTEVEQASPPALPTWFKIDDGSGVAVKCVVPVGVTINPAWQHVAVTGLSSCELANRRISRVLRVRGPGDTVTFAAR